jgi:anti-anti-sigma factor
VSHQDAVVWYLRLHNDFVEGVTVLTAAGRVSSLTAPALEKALRAAIGVPGQGVVLDLTRVDYISSQGLRAVDDAAAQLQHGGRRLVLCGLKDAVVVAFDLAGLSSTLTIEETRDAAAARARAG